MLVQKIIIKNIDKITKALTYKEEKASDDPELEKIYGILTKYLESNSIQYEEDKVRNFIAREL